MVRGDDGQSLTASNSEASNSEAGDSDVWGDWTWAVDEDDCDETAADEDAMAQCEWTKNKGTDEMEGGEIGLPQKASTRKRKR